MTHPSESVHDDDDEVGGPGSITVVPKAGSAVISQTRAVHGEILELLRALRAARDLAEKQEE